MTNRTHTVVHMSVGTGLLVSGLVAIVGAAIILAGLFVETAPEQTKPRDRILPRIGNVDPVPSKLGSAAAAEATYGPVNKAALNEAKQGLISRVVSNVRARRTARIASRCPCPCSTQPPPLPQGAYVSLVDLRIPMPVHRQPVYRTPKPGPLNDSPCDNGGCRIDVKPSQEQPSTQALRSEILESTFGPVNKAALGETKQAPYDPADHKPTLPPDYQLPDLPPVDSPSPDIEPAGSDAASGNLDVPAEATHEERLTLPPLRADPPVEWRERITTAPDTPATPLPIRPSATARRELAIKPSR
ncbi:MAG: hypothetical protein Aurels2KO_25460 [Aureliella sp.]